MKKPEDCNNLDEIRTAINNIDEKIVSLIARRSRYVKKAAEFKKDEKAVRDKKRVEEVIKTKKALAGKYGISPVLIETLYTHMINFFIREEMKEWKK